jgi:membrane-associated protease RseP (regulator of RpoE activity)
MMNKHKLKKTGVSRGWMFWVAIVPMFGAVAMAGADLYVSPAGSDTNPGSQGRPVASLARARDLARPMVGKSAVTVHVADGVYYLPETLTFSAADSGSEKNPVAYKADNEGGAVLSGGSGLDLKWTPYQNGIFQAKTPQGLEIDQLFINGKAQRMARYPNYDPEKKTDAYQGYAADAFSKERAANWADPAGGYIHAMHSVRWGGYHYRITGKDAEGNVTYEGGWQNNRQMGMHKDYRMVENIFEELDAPGEWFHNTMTSTLFYMPAAGTDLEDAKVEVVRLRHLIEFRGTQDAPVKFITLQGFTVRHAARTFMDCKEPLLRSDWAIYRGGAFLLTGAEDVSILDCEFDQVGGNAVFVNNYNRRVRVAGCHIHDAGASGVCFVGDPEAVRDPLFEYNEVNDLSKIDRTPGPKTDNYPAESIVEDCLIHGIGRVERQPAGVQISMAQGITVRDLSIYDCARSGINVSEGTWGGHLIEGCDVFDTVLETHDHGSFNSWGRDRYWRKDVKTSQRAINEDPELPFLDAVKTTVIRNSRWRCDHGWDVDLDDGSSNYDIYNNLLLAKGLKLREGFRRHAWNNVIVNSGLHPHVWYEGSKDQVTGNILMGQHRPARIKRPNADGAMVDQNLFFVADEAKAKVVSENLGWDKNSLYGDPLFVDPASGDFRVKEGSPALKLGFKNFPMDQFGVKKPSLRKIARTPQLPVLPAALTAKAASSKAAPKAPATKPIRAEHPVVWLGATLQTMGGEDFSAYGVGKEEGGVVLIEVPEGSEAARRGLLEVDVVQQVNGKAVRTSEALLKAVARAGNKPLRLKVVRNQTTMDLVIAQHAWVQTETAVNEFKQLPVPASRSRALFASMKTNNDPLNSLVDGKLARSYGPVFANGARKGAYKMDLGRVKTVKAISSWSCQLGKRGAQRLTLYGSASNRDPGWDTNRLTPIGSIDTRGNHGAIFQAASLRAADDESFGEFRWIVWKVAPVSPAAGGEHTAFQELHVECMEAE